MSWPDIFAKSFVVLVIVILLNHLLSRLSAAVRHFLCFLGLLIVGLLPLFSKIAPNWQLRILPPTSKPGLTTAVESALNLEEPGARIVRGNSILPSHNQEDGSSTGVMRKHQAPSTKTLQGAVSWLRWIWFMGFVATATPMLVGTFSVWRMRRNSTLLIARETLDLIDIMSAEMGVAGSVEVRISSTNIMPIACGWWSSLILLPATFEDQSREEQELVLRHELAHVKRRDCLTQTVAWFICCVHWFNPLAWIAVRAMRIQRERACDDLVLRHGGRASAYADYLLQIARKFSRSQSLSVAAIAIAKPTQLEGRLLAILEPKQSRSSLLKRHVFFALALSVCIVFPMAGCRTITKRMARKPVNSSAPDFRFKRDYGAGLGPAYVVVEDFDGDDRLDIIVANGQIESDNGRDNSISIFRNITSENSKELGFAEKVDLPAGSYPFGLAAADIDQDGKVDVAVPCHTANGIVIYRNISSIGGLDSKSFAEPITLPTLSGPQTIELADLNCDGRPDIVVPNNGHGRGNSISIFENASESGAVRFRDRIDVVTGTQPGGAVVDDFNADGLPDIAVVNLLSHTISVLANRSRGEHLAFGSFARKIDFAVGDKSNYPQKVVSGDLDNDGLPELVVGNLTDTSGIQGYISIFKNISSPGQIAFGNRVDIEGGISGTSCPILGDLNGDGWIDLIVGNHHGDTVSIFINAGSEDGLGANTFRVPYVIKANLGASNPKLADLNRDGKIDIVVPNIRGASISVFSQ